MNRLQVVSGEAFVRVIDEKGDTVEKIFDYTLHYMLTHPTIPFTLQSYLSLNWCGDVADVSELDAEALADLPEQLYPEPASKLVQ